MSWLWQVVCLVMAVLALYAWGWVGFAHWGRVNETGKCNLMMCLVLGPLSLFLIPEEVVDDECR